MTDGDVITQTGWITLAWEFKFIVVTLSFYYVNVLIDYSTFPINVFAHDFLQACSGACILYRWLAADDDTASVKVSRDELPCASLV